MDSKLRLNVVCPSRDKKFLVIADDEWLIEDVKACIEIVFHKLYPTEPELNISTLQNEFHFDLLLDYSVGDALVDAGLVFAIEDVPLPISRCAPREGNKEREEEVSTEDLGDCKPQPPKRRKKQKLSKKKILTKKIRHPKPVCTSSDKVTSTTSPVMHHSSHEKGFNLLPQIVEKNSSEDTEVDIETVEEEDFSHEVDVIN